MLISARFTLYYLYYLYMLYYKVRQKAGGRIVHLFSRGAAGFIPPHLSFFYLFFFFMLYYKVRQKGGGGTPFFARAAALKLYRLYMLIIHDDMIAARYAENSVLLLLVRKMRITVLVENFD